MSLLAMLGSSRAVAQYTAAQAKNDEKRMNAAASMQDRCLVLQLDGAACAIHAESVGPSMAEMAESNKLVAAMVDRLALFNGVASVGIAMMPLVYQVVANHAPKETRDNMPPQLLSLGVLPPQNAEQFVPKLERVATRVVRKFCSRERIVERRIIRTVKLPRQASAGATCRVSFMVKLLRAYGGCLGARRR